MRAASRSSSRLLFVTSCLPLLLTALPPLLDYPNHLARMYLLPHLPDAGLARYYIVQLGADPRSRHGRHRARSSRK